MATALLTALIPGFGCGGQSRGNDSGGSSGSGPTANGCEADGKSVECAVCQDIESEYARALEHAKGCDYHQSNPCSAVIVEGLACGCEAFVNPENAEAIAQVQALQEQYGAGQCGGGVVCGPCLPPLSVSCSIMEGRCETVYDPAIGDGCKVSGVVYASGTDGIPDPVSCNTCRCFDGRLLCTELICPMDCPPDSLYATQCAQCGGADGCEVLEHACLPVCSGSCESGACIAGEDGTVAVCRVVCD